MPIELVVPKVGESIVEVEIAEWLKHEGEAVQEDEPVAILDSEKTTVELRSPGAGVLGKIVKQQGETAAIGEVVGYVEEAGAASSNSEKPGEPKPEWNKASQVNAPSPNGQTGESIGKIEAENLQTAGEAPPAGTPPLVMPAARRALAEHGLRAEDVAGTGPGGRLLKEDVLQHVEQSAARAGSPSEVAVPTVAPSAPVGAVAPATVPASGAAEVGEDEEAVPMNLLRRRIAQRLVEAQQTAALLTTFNEVDMSGVMALRKEYQEAFQKRYDIKLGFMSFFVKAAIDALKQIPAVNAEIRGSSIVYKNHYDIGVAVGSGKGLVVPVLRHAERLSFAEVELAIADFGKRARDSKLVPDELIGGTFTISNGGVYGSLLSTPIVNPPQSGILGMHAIQDRPVARDGQAVIRPMMYLALTYDHRVVDGREAVTFLVRIKECIENPTRMLIEV